MVTDRSNIEEMLFDSLMGHRNGIVVVESVVDTRHMAGIVNHGGNVVLTMTMAQERLSSARVWYICS